MSQSVFLDFFSGLLINLTKAIHTHIYMYKTKEGKRNVPH